MKQIGSGARSSFPKDIKQFFSRNIPVGLHFPDGWFGGRPMENHCDLTFVHHSPSHLILELNDHILLTFCGKDLCVERTIIDLLTPDGAPAVTVTDFVHCVVDNVYQGATDGSVDVYREGVIAFVSPC